jgi:SAM-dependent methyltransferase
VSQCLDCRMLVKNQCSAYTIAKQVLGRELPPPPLGACMIPIVEDYLRLITKGMSILEIGCGSWDLIKKHCESVGAYYEGIDTEAEHFGNKTVATRIENLAKLSFPDEYFDLVIGNQTMEHWAEYGCTLQWGLYQCFRVCKQNGQVLMNVPIHFHGTWQFILGKLEIIESLFAPFSEKVCFYKWGSPSHPISSLFPHPGYWLLQKKPAYILDIHAVKDRKLPSGYNNHGATSRRFAQLFNYPLSYNVYRVLRKAGLFQQNYTFLPQDILE